MNRTIDAIKHKPHPIQHPDQASHRAAARRLRLTAADLKPDGIHVTPHKTEGSTGKRLIIDWSPELAEAVDTAKTVRPALSTFLFYTRKGTGYINEKKGTASG